MARELSNEFQDVEDVRVFGSLAKKEETGLSDVDILIIIAYSQEKDSLERMKPYYFFLSKRLTIGFDLLVLTKEELKKSSNGKKLFEQSQSLLKR